MWEQYKKTFLKMQVIIWGVSLAVYLAFGHILAQAAIFFVVMQWSAVIGAVWAVRFKAMAARREEGLLRPRN